MATKKSPDPSELQIALDNRAFEIQLFWQRSNYFLVLMTALGIGTFSIKDSLFSTVIAGFATACSYFWFRTNLGSKFWQESWEVEVTELSKEFGVRSFEKPLGEVREQVQRSLVAGQAAETRSFVRKWIDGLTVKKYSVTYNMILLSFVSTILWFLVAVVLTYRSLSGANDRPVSPAGVGTQAPVEAQKHDKVMTGNKATQIKSQSLSVDRSKLPRPAPHSPEQPPTLPANVATPSRK